MKPSTAAVLHLLRERESITSAVALRELHQSRLAARVAELRREGFVIRSTIRDGYAVYSLIEAGQLEMRLAR